MSLISVSYTHLVMKFFEKGGFVWMLLGVVWSFVTGDLFGMCAGGVIGNVDTCLLYTSRGV